VGLVGKKYDGNGHFAILPLRGHSPPLSPRAGGAGCDAQTFPLMESVTADISASIADEQPLKPFQNDEQELGVAHDFPPTPHDANTQTPVVCTGE
jgi:hypothetical protein